MVFWFHLELGTQIQDQLFGFILDPSRKCMALSFTIV